MQSRGGVIFSNHFIVVLVAICFVLIASLLLSRDAFAGREVNSRLSYGDTATYCGSGGSRGMVWISNDGSDYYSERVNISETTGVASVQVRGAVNTCSTPSNGSDTNQAWAVSVESRSGGFTVYGTEFWRGNVERYQRNNWSTGHEGAWNGYLSAALDLSSAAPCSASGNTGSSSAIVNVAVHRSLQWRQLINGSWLITNGLADTETVSIPVTRSCPVFNYDLTPQITSVTHGSELATPKSAVPVSGNVANIGPTASKPGTNWRITQVVFPVSMTLTSTLLNGATSPNDPCAYFTGESACGTITDGSGATTYPVTGGSPIGHAGTADVVKWPPNTWICFALSVQPYNQSTSDWRHSGLRCYRAAKEIKPKVDVVGGDLYVGRKPLGMTTTVSARVITSQTTNTAGTFGSWGEYAIAASGPVTSMASGSAYVGGAPTYPNLLTFVNTAHTTSSCATLVGCYAQNGSLPNIGARFPTSGATASFTGGTLNGISGLRTGTGDISIGGSTIAAGTSVIINAPEADITISGNITYNVGGGIGSFSQIPQVIIIAKNITIARTVTQVDAWLVAPGKVTASGGVTDGLIETCDVAATSLNAGICNQKLTINGPVIANKLHMLRTTGVDNETAAVGDPAEVFNFRPDAYLWALQQAQQGGRVTTVSTKELPPRY